MKKLLVALGILAVVAAASIVAARIYAAKRAEEGLFTTKALGATTPADVGIEFAALTVPSGTRQLGAWFVRAQDTSVIHTGVLIFHGNGTSIAEQVGLQQVLFGHGFSSLVFDYSGYGGSTGEPTVANLREDALAAFQVFADSMGFSSRKFLLGTTLGAAVMLDAIEDLQGSVDGVIVVGTFASGLETAVRRGHVPAALAFFLPDPYDNVEAARKLEKPLLVIHSAADEVFPIEDAERILAAPTAPKRLVRLESTSHDAYLATGADWEPVIQFILSGGAR